MSERDGWNHLYLYDGGRERSRTRSPAANGSCAAWTAWTKGKRQVWFRAGGIRPGQDPYYIHYCRVNFDGTA